MLLEDTGFENYVSALPGGQSRRANLEALIKNAGIYSNSGHGIRGFLRFMEKARSGDSSGGGADSLGQRCAAHIHTQEQGP